MSTSKAKGFTLIELLVVITIVGLLAALLFPVFAKVRENANKTVCESNMHQIGLAIQMYQSDNNGILPTQFSDASEIESKISLNMILFSPTNTPRPSTIVPTRSIMLTVYLELLELLIWITTTVSMNCSTAALGFIQTAQVA